MTLTVDDEHRRVVSGKDGTRAVVDTVSPYLSQLWVKRCRYRLAPQALRFVAVGEYGERTGRGHYHALLYGVDGEQAEEVAKASWKEGFVEVGEFTNASAAYVAGYVAKKLTKAGDSRLVEGQHPEFMRQSLKPPIGAGGVEYLAALCHTRGGALYIAETRDVPSVFRLEGKVWPLDRTMKRRLREAMGLPAVDLVRQAKAWQAVVAPPEGDAAWMEAERQAARIKRRLASKGAVL